MATEKKFRKAIKKITDEPHGRILEAKTTPPSATLGVPSENTTRTAPGIHVHGKELGI
jgi:hypothetical protein